MTDQDPVKRLTLKLGVICEGEEPHVVLASLTTLFAALTAPVEDETFGRSVDFFRDTVGRVREELRKQFPEKTETPQ